MVAAAFLPVLGLEELQSWLAAARTGLKSSLVALVGQTGCKGLQLPAAAEGVRHLRVASQSTAAVQQVLVRIC